MGSGNAIASVPPALVEAGSARILEKGIRRLLERPAVFTSGALVVSTAIAASGGFDSRHTALIFGAELLGFLGWLRLWTWRRPTDPAAVGAGTIILAMVGIVLLASLSYHHLSFALVAVTLLPTYYTMLPLPIAILSYFPMFYTTELSHTRAVLGDPTQIPLSMFFIRGGAVILIGICFKVLALQIEERKRLEASLVSAERKAGKLEERQRLAREIHDTLAQGFASIIVHLERTEQINGMAHSPAKGHLDLARSVAREGLEEARRMMAALRPEILEQRALPEALDRVCQEWSRRTGIESRLSITGTASPMHPEIELTILRGVQEGLTNVARHSGAHTTAVTLSYMEDVIVLDVQDDGKGFTSTPGSGYGLTGMRERVERLEGTMQVESVPGEGTTISLTLPVLHPMGGDGAGAGA